jgi:PAS domain S-box-containing protein
VIGIARAVLAAAGAGYTLMQNVAPQTITFGSLVLFMLVNGYSFILLAQERAGRKLIKTRERLLRARRMTKMASMEVDIESRRSLWSSGLPELLGLEPGREPKTWTDYRALIHPDDLDRVDDSVTQAQSGKPLDPDEYRILGGDGKWRWLRRETEILPAADGRGRGTILITLQDVTERVHMEDELRQGNISLKRAQRMGRIGSADIDLNTMKVAWSDELYDIYGRDPAEGPADLDTFLTYLHPDDRYLIPAIREQYLSGIPGSSTEFRIVRPDGGIRWIHREAEQIADATGKPLGLITVEQDVTERVLMEKELRRGHDRLALAQRTGRIGSSELDMRTGTSVRSDEFYRVLGLDPAKVKANDIEKMIEAYHPDDRDTLRDIMRRTANGETLPATDLRIVRPDGSIGWIRRHHDFQRAADGTPETAIITVQDVTDQKLLEQAKDEFVSTVSHELRTPLTSIRGALALVTASIGSDVPEKLRHLIDVALRNSDRLAHLVDDLLDVQRIAAGRMIYHLADVSLAPLIEDAVEANRPFGAKHGVEIRLGAMASGALVHADAERLMQVMNNLLSNAIKYSKPGQTVEVSLERRSPWVRITVTDHGEGIPAAFHGKMFKPFSQSDSSDARRKGGSGLGLSIIDAIVKRHDGRVSFETEMGRGTRFHVDLKELGDVAQPQAEPPARAVG